MKNYYLYLFCLCLMACEVAPNSILSFEGPALKAVPTIVSRTQCENLLGPLAANQAVRFSLNGLALESQFDDLDGDGQWDEAILVLDRPNEIKLSKISLEQIRTPEPRTNLHFAKVIKMGEEYEEVSFGERISGTETKVTQTHFQFEGPGWENDVIAFRNYFDERNGFDIFGKTTPKMILSQVGTGQNYHELLPWGMDILKVGNSLGSGGIALWYKDSLYRVSVPQGATYKAIVEGPRRSVFELRFPAMSVGEHTVDVLHTVSIYAGVHGFSSEVSVSPFVEGISLAVGIVNLETEELYEAKVENTNMIYTHDNQAFLHEKLGMGIVTHEADFLAKHTAPEAGEGVIQTYLSLLKLYPDKTTPYLFIAAWEKTDPQFAQKANFVSLLEGEALRWQIGLGVID